MDWKRIAQQPETLKTVQEVLQKYPVKYGMWGDPGDDGFSAFVSDLKGNGYNDPWGRPLPQGTPVYDRENDITHWEVTTTVAGVPIKLTIWND